MNNANKFGATLNLRGRLRQTGVKAGNYVKTNGKQNIVIIAATIVLFLLFTLINSNFASSANLLVLSKSLVPYAIMARRHQHRSRAPS